MLILIIEDDEAIRSTLKMFCQYFNGNECETVADIEEARAFIKKRKPDMILLDILLKGEQGWCLIDEIRYMYEPAPSIVVISAMSNIQKELEKYKPYAYLQKPFELDSLQSLISQLNN